MKTKLPQHISSVSEAEEFLRSLYDNGELYHPDLQAEEIIDSDGNRVFSDKEAIRLNFLMDECHACVFDRLDIFNPVSFCLDLYLEPPIYHPPTDKEILTAELLKCFDLENFREFKAKTEELYIRHKLKENGYNVAQTARKIDLQRSHVYNKIERFNLQRFDDPNYERI